MTGQRERAREKDRQREGEGKRKREREGEGKGGRKATKNGKAQGGVYVELYKVLAQAAEQQGGSSEQSVRTVYKNGNKEEGMVVGAGAVKEAARAQGAQINERRPAAMRAVRTIMKWVDSGTHGARAQARVRARV